MCEKTRRFADERSEKRGRKAGSDLIQWKSVGMFNLLERRYFSIEHSTFQLEIASL